MSNPNPSIEQILQLAPWASLEEHLNGLRQRVDNSITRAQRLRVRYREELLASQPDIAKHIHEPSSAALTKACELLTTGTVAASDGTISPVPLLGGTKIQVGVVIVFNTGEVVDLVTRVFEAELVNETNSATEFFGGLRKSRKMSNLVSRAIMLFGERKLLLEYPADWRMMHGELIPHELRTGAGQPSQNLKSAFDLIHQYIESKHFIAVSEGPDDIDILNAAILLEPGEYIKIRTLADTLESFLYGDEETGQSRANFTKPDLQRFQDFIKSIGSQVSVVLVKAGPKPFLIECHTDCVEDAVALFLADSLWTRGFDMSKDHLSVRGFPFHIDLADQVARTLFKGSDFQRFVESRLFELGVESGMFDIDPRRTRA